MRKDVARVLVDDALDEDAVNRLQAHPEPLAHRPPLSTSQRSCLASGSLAEQVQRLSAGSLPSISTASGGIATRAESSLPKWSVDVGDHGRAARADLADQDHEDHECGGRAHEPQHDHRADRADAGDRAWRVHSDRGGSSTEAIARLPPIVARGSRPARRCLISIGPIA